MTRPRPHFDEVSLAALEAAREAGGTPASWGGLLPPEDLPLAFAVFEANLELLEIRVAVLEQRLDRRRLEPLGEIVRRLEIVR